MGCLLNFTSAVFKLVIAIKFMSHVHLLTSALKRSLAQRTKNLHQHIHLYPWQQWVSNYERACSLVVTRAPVAPQVLGPTPRGANFSGFNGICAFSGRRRSRRRRGACGDFVNLEDLPVVFEDAPRGRVCVCVFIGMCVRALWVSPMYCVIRKKQWVPNWSGNSENGYLTH
jgi:hypothetical protein